MKCLPFTRDALKAVKNEPGYYEIYDKKGERLYVGSSKRLRHRAQSYKEKDSFAAHPTKKSLREKQHCIKVTYTPIEKARVVEKKKKQDCPFNYR